MATAALAAEKAGTFLLARRGAPAVVGLAGLALALLEPAGRGWYLLVSMACAADIWPTFRSGADYLRTRQVSLRWDGLWVRALRPLARWLGRESEWILSFCGWNNRRVREAFENRKARRALVLLPHCIQAAGCRAEVIQGLGNCFSCGQCPVGDTLAKSIAGRWHCRITNRSHKAYREAREFKPDLVVAVSCPDRLLKGLLKLSEVPCYVIPLELPHGMCVDTTFSVPHLAAAMEILVEPRVAGEENIQPLRTGTGD